MAFFDFFPDRSRDVARLVERSRNLPDDPAFSQQVESVFGSLIERRLTASERTDEALRSAILVELDGLIRSLLPTDADFAEHYRTVVNDLIDACRWKQFFGRIPPAELADRGIRYRANIQAQIERYHNDPAATRLRRLTRLLTNDDRTAVARRTLRAFVAFAGQPHRHPQQTALFWLRDGRVQLQWPRFREYLSEQIAFYVYLVHDDQDVNFLLEAMVGVKNWVTNRITNELGAPGPEELAGIDDILSQTREIFMQKCRRLRIEPESLYIDASLTTYLIGIVKKNRAVEKLIYPNQPPPTDEEQNSEEDANQPTRPLTNSPDAYDPGDDDDEQRDLLRRCLELLKENCRTLIKRRYYDPYYGQPVPFATLASMLGSSANALEKQHDKCLELLTNCAQNGNRPSPYVLHSS